MGLFSKEKTIQLEDIRTPAAKKLGSDYLSRLQSAVGQYQPGSDFGAMSVGLSEPEKQSLSYLQNYINADVTKSDLYKAGRGEITNTLSGSTYDPTTGQYYKSTRAAMDLSTQQAIDDLRRGQALRGGFRSSGALRQEGDILTQSNIANQQLLAKLAEKERERRAAAGTQALQLAEYETNIPLTKTQYAQTYGALERQNEISNLEREYKKWQDQRTELMNAFTAAGKASNEGQPVYGQTSYKVTQPTTAGKISSFALPAIGAYFGGPAGAQAGAKLSELLISGGI